MFIDECNPSKILIFKMASNSVEVTDVPFKFATPTTVAIGDTLCSDRAILVQGPVFKGKIEQHLELTTREMLLLTSHRAYRNL